VTSKPEYIARLSARALGSAWARYMTSAAIIAIIIGLRAYVIPAWSPGHPYLLFYPGIIIAGWVGGFGPGILATVLAALSLAVRWLPQVYSLGVKRIDDASGMMVFVAIGFAISLLSEARLRAKRRA